MKNSDILKNIAEIPLFADLICIIENGNFVSPNQDPMVEGGGVFLGEMNIVEKALYTMHSQCKDEQRALLRVSPLEEYETQKELKVLYDKAQTAMEYFWESVRPRFAEERSEMETAWESGSALYIHSDFSITLQAEDDEPETGPHDMLARALSGSLFPGFFDDNARGVIGNMLGMLSEDDDDHDCEDCEHVECSSHPLYSED